MLVILLSGKYLLSIPECGHEICFFINASKDMHIAVTLSIHSLGRISANLVGF